MATPNANDNTALGTGELISNESIETGASRGDTNLPVAAYKVPRSKIAVGNYGQDLGDASKSIPLPVESMQERQAAELNSLRALSLGLREIRRSAAENDKYAAFDVRGQVFETRGKR